MHAETKQLDFFAQKILERSLEVFKEITLLDVESKIDLLNILRLELHKLSPFKEEPVDCVQWIKSEHVQANDYNPNTVAPPEMRLLARSIESDGYTQPIVAWWSDGHFEVVDGFHRNRVGKESISVRERILGYLPITIINNTREERNDRIAATIRHNRARGKHQVMAMSDIVIELKRRNWTNERIGRELGMDEDEILRLCQITGLSELFGDQEFSRSWDTEGEVTEADFRELTDNVDSYGEETEKFRTVNTSDEERIFHTYEKWECYKAGFYATTKDGMTKQQCEAAYRDLLADTERFGSILHRVITEWKYSCEHYLTNKAMNRLAWLGQAALAYELGIPSCFRSGFYLLTVEQQERADETALEYLNKWLTANHRSTVDINEARSGDRQSQIY